MGRPLPLRVLDSTEPHDRLGRPLRDLRISVIDRCNFRCPYCMPEEQYPRDHAFLASRERLTVAEIQRLARIFVALGVVKLRLTGGEPLLRKDLAEIVGALSRIEGAQDLALTTNGALLAAQAAGLRAAGLKRLTVSLDALDAATFARMSGGRGKVEDVLAGIDAAERAGFASIKLNTVVRRGDNEDCVLQLLERFRGTPHVVRFIEYMDVGTCNGWQPAMVVPTSELVARIGARWPLVARARSHPGEVAERYAYADGQGEIGFVSSVSAPFCGDCNRARLSADGMLYTCLFSGAGTDLRTPLRAGATDAELDALVRSVWHAREDRYSELRAAGAETRAAARVEMYRMGG